MIQTLPVLELAFLFQLSWLAIDLKKLSNLARPVDIEYNIAFWNSFFKKT